MNRNCEGAWFVANGTKYYRCLADGRVESGLFNEQICPNCKRYIRGIDHGKLELHIIKQVVFPNGWVVDLPEQKTPKRMMNDAVD